MWAHDARARVWTKLRVDFGTRTTRQTNSSYATAICYRATLTRGWYFAEGHRHRPDAVHCRIANFWRGPVRWALPDLINGHFIERKFNKHEMTTDFSNTCAEHWVEGKAYPGVPACRVWDEVPCPWVQWSPLRRTEMQEFVNTSHLRRNSGVDDHVDHLMSKARANLSYVHYLHKNTGDIERWTWMSKCMHFQLAKCTL